MIEIIPSSVCDGLIETEFKESKPWGLEAVVNVYNCDEKLISDGDYIKKFAKDIVDFIGMKAFGEPFIERFGSGNLYGFTMIQPIYTSCITAHFAEEDRRIFINIFSCAPFSPNKTAEFAMNYFKGKSVELKTILRD